MSDQDISSATIEQVLLNDDLSKLSVEQRLSYYNAVCKSIGVNPLTKPFGYITLNNKLVLYAKRDCTDQLRSLKNISIVITSRETIGDIYVVTARASNPDGRTDESTGAVNLKNIAGDALANAYMKAETKAKRRVTLSLAGLGFLDESEIETTTSTVVQPETPAIPEKVPAKEHSLDELKNFILANRAIIGWTTETMWGEIQKLQPEANHVDMLTRETLVTVIKQMKALHEAQVSDKNPIK